MRRIALVAATLIAVCGLPAPTASAATIGQLSSGSSSTGAVATPMLLCDVAPFLPGCGLRGNPF